MKPGSPFLLDPSIIFLNHGSFGACPQPVFAAYQTLQRELESQPVRFLGREYHQRLAHARSVLGAYLGAHPDYLVFVPNATHGVNIIARSLHLNPGDEILTSAHEYGACDYTWEFLCAKSGVQINHQPIPFPASTNEEMLEQFWSGVTPTTRLIFLSHITSPTALRLPVEAICARARQHGILTLIDGAHAPGQIPLHLDTLQADFYTGNCHKWMLAPKGSAFLYAHPAVQHLVEPLIVSWGYHTDPALSSGSRFVDWLTWTGTHDPAAYLSVPAAIQFLQKNNWNQVQQRCHLLLEQYLPQFSEVTGKPILYRQSGQYSQMAAIEMPHLKDLHAFKTALYDQYHIEIPAIEWQNRHFLRISIQAYNDESDLQALLAALTQLIREYTVMRN
ncbi:MAG: aminotransferase [Chloroflexi bacterium HGW-Chloroflexi-10]|nr:MAG: aminotransferase [Chloroflexi bacterium HGW-Chloroflexi-10]